MNNEFLEFEKNFNSLDNIRKFYQEKKKQLKNIFNFDEWLKKICYKTYYFHSWDVSNLDETINNLSIMVKPYFERNTVEIVEKYLLFGEYSKYRNYLTAKDFFPTKNDVPELINDFISIDEHKRILKEKLDSMQRELSIKIYEYAFRDLLDDDYGYKEQIINLMKQNIELTEKIKNLQSEINLLQSELQKEII